MIQDIAPKKFYNQFAAKKPSANSRILSFSDGKILYKEKDGEMEFLTFKQVEAHFIQEKEKSELPVYTYLFSIDREDFFLMNLQDQVFEDFTYHRMFETRRLYPKEYVLAAATGWHLYVWYRDNQFCGRCAKKLVHDEHLRMMKCPSCGNMVFPKIAPAVIVGVTNGDKILMTKYAGREYKKYALIAGFTEIGETAEQTVEREVMEEVGLSVENIRYYKSQPWSFSGTLLFGFFCDVDGDDTLTVDHEELSMAQWVERDKIPDQGNNISLTKEMMMLFRDGKEPR